MKTNSIKLITLVSKKLMLQKKILNYNEMIKDIDILIESDVNNNLISLILNLFLKNY
jgi:hypothetical protein